MKKLLKSDMTADKKEKMMKCVALGAGALVTVTSLPASHLVMKIASGAAAIAVSVGLGLIATAVVYKKLTEKYSI